MVYNDTFGVKQLLDEVPTGNVRYESLKWTGGGNRSIFPDELNVSNFLQTQNLDTATGSDKDTWVDFNAHGWDCPGHGGNQGDANQARINGTGEMTLEGRYPRCYIYDTANPTTRQWRNFEFTAFCKAFEKGTWSNPVYRMSMRGRTHHHRYGYCNCNGSGYVAQLEPGANKELEFRKEYAHAAYNDTKIANAFFDFQMNKWYGFKLIVQGKPSSETEVQLKFYTNGGGAIEGDKQTWNLLASFTDKGADGVDGVTRMPINHGDDLSNMPGIVAGCTSNCIDSNPLWQQSPYTEIIDMKGCCVYLRADFFKNIKFKWVNVHTVAALT